MKEFKDLTPEEKKKVEELYNTVEKHKNKKLSKVIYAGLFTWTFGYLTLLFSPWTEFCRIWVFIGVAISAFLAWLGLYLHNKVYLRLGIIAWLCTMAIFIVQFYILAKS